MMSTITGKAAVLFAPNTELRVIDVNFAPPRSGEVRVKIRATGICHSDAYYLKGTEITGGRLNEINGPLIVGHEAAGVIESIGEGVTSVSVGDHVIILWLPQCDSCSFCLSKPMTNLCQAPSPYGFLREDGSSPVTLPEDGSPVLTLMNTGTFAEYVVLKATSVYKILEDIPFELACIFGCAVGTGYGSASNIAKVPPSSTCAVWGLGAVGLSTIIGCKAAGASRIVAIDVNPEKEKLAMELGATEFFNPRDGDVVAHLVQGQGLDFCFECSGVPVCMTQAMSALASWGMLVVVGLQPKDSTLSVDVEKLLMGQKITGGFFGGCKPKEGLRILISEYLAGRLDCSKLITHRMTLDKINQGFELLHTGKSIRTVIIF